jgi:hypothetical protein
VIKQTVFNHSFPERNEYVLFRIFCPTFLIAYLYNSAKRDDRGIGGTDSRKMAVAPKPLSSYTTDKFVVIKNARGHISICK